MGVMTRYHQPVAAGGGVLTLGRRSDGRPVSVPWPAGMGRWLISGMTGSGKSGWVNALVGELAGQDDAALFGIDLKGGLELAPWLSRLTGLAITPVAATHLLGEVRELIDARAARLSSTGARSWSTDLGPIVVVIVDELAELGSIDTDSLVAALSGEGDANKIMRGAKVELDARVALLSSIARLGRALGVFVVASTQYPLWSVVPVELRAQLDYRVACRLLGSEQVRVALGDGVAEYADVEAITVDQPGCGVGVWAAGV